MYNFKPFTTQHVVSQIVSFCLWKSKLTQIDSSHTFPWVDPKANKNHTAGWKYPLFRSWKFINATIHLTFSVYPITKFFFRSFVSRSFDNKINASKKDDRLVVPLGSRDCCIVCVTTTDCKSCTNSLFPNASSIHNEHPHINDVP